jgi:hypothetical protein
VSPLTPWPEPSTVADQRPERLDQVVETRRDQPDPTSSRDHRELGLLPERGAPAWTLELDRDEAARDAGEDIGHAGPLTQPAEHLQLLGTHKPEIVTDRGRDLSLGFQRSSWFLAHRSPSSHRRTFGG